MKKINAQRKGQDIKGISDDQKKRSENAYKDVKVCPSTILLHSSVCCLCHQWWQTLTAVTQNILLFLKLFKNCCLHLIKMQENDTCTAHVNYSIWPCVHLEQKFSQDS